MGRLLAKLREGHAALTRARRDLEAKASAMARLEQMHDALLRRNQALEHSLAQLEERHAALLRDRELMLERVEAGSPPAQVLTLAVRRAPSRQP